MGIALAIQNAGNAAFSSSGGLITPSSVIAITQVDVIDTTPDASGNPQKQVSVLFTPPSPQGSFAGNWVYNDMPDSAGGLNIADGTVPANGTNPAAGTFQPAKEGFFPYAAATAATVTGTFTGNPTDGETVTLAGKTYTFQSSLTNVDGNVQIGFTATASINNLRAAIDLLAGAGTAYAAATTANPGASASNSLHSAVLVCTALTAGTSGNSLTASATAPVTWSNGGAFSNGAGSIAQIVFVAPAPTVPAYWRVYLCPGSQSIAVQPVQAGLPGASVSFQYWVGLPATVSTGREYAPLVLNVAFAPIPAGWNGNPDEEVAASGDQYFQYAVTWNWPVNDQNFQSLGGVDLILENNTTGIQTDIGDTSAGNGNPTYTSAHLPVLPGVNDYTLYLISYDVNNNKNSLIPGITPQITFSITRSLGAGRRGVLRAGGAGRSQSIRHGRAGDQRRRRHLGPRGHRVFCAAGGPTVGRRRSGCPQTKRRHIYRGQGHARTDRYRDQPAGRRRNLGVFHSLDRRER